MKKRQVVISVVIMLMLLCTSVYATISGNISLTSSAKDSISAGDEFTVTLSLNNIEGNSGVTSISGYINVNDDVFEKLTVDSIVTNSEGKVEINSNNVLDVYDSNDEEASSADTGITFNSNPVSGNGDYRLVIDLENALTSDTDLVTITFKVKDNVAEGNYEDAISYTLFKIYSGTTDKADVISQSLDVNVGNEVIPDDPDNNPENVPDNRPENNVDNNIDEGNNINNNINDNNSNNIQDDNNNDDKNNSNPIDNNQGQDGLGTNNGEDNTIAPGRLPNTGYKFIILPIIVLLVAGFIFYKKYDKYSKF